MKAFLIVTCVVVCAAALIDVKVREKRQANNYWQRYQEERQAYADQQQQMYADRQRQMYDERQAAYQQYEQQQRDEATRRFEEQMDARYGRGKRAAVDNNTETVSTQESQDSLVRQKRQAYGYGGYGIPADPAIGYAQRFARGYGQSYGGVGGGYYPNSPYDGRIYSYGR
ncbi:hypothetical protein SNE40_000223 [Patella caerulea]|uniref:Uncharacterized protein n=1 Tax=Patella caerulea TaxID=87958 RepID=A0AAN8Q9R4_PATCE